MARIRLVASVLLVLFAFAPAAPTSAWAFGAPLMKGVTPAQLAGLVDESLKQDLEGNARLDAERCKKDGSCATPRIYFEGIKQLHPSVELKELNELSRYLRSLVEHEGPKGVWRMTRLLVDGDDVRHDAKGRFRAFHSGEKAWYDPNGGEPVLAGDCSNIIGEMLKPKPRLRRFVVTTPPPAYRAPSAAAPSATRPIFGRVPKALCSPTGAQVGIPIKRC